MESGDLHGWTPEERRRGRSAALRLCRVLNRPTCSIVLVSSRPCKIGGPRAGRPRGTTFPSRSWVLGAGHSFRRVWSSRCRPVCRQTHGSRRPVAKPAQWAQPKALDRPLLWDPEGAAKASVTGADAGACRVFQLRCARGAQPRGAGEPGVLPGAPQFWVLPRRYPLLQAGGAKGPGGGWDAGCVRRWRRKRER